MNPALSNSIQIRALATSDFSAVESFLCANLSPDEFNFSLSKAEMVLGAFRGDRLIAAAVAIRNPMQAKVARLVVAVDPAFRRQSVGRALHEKMLSQVSIDPAFGVDGACDGGNSVAIDFMRALGYEPLMESQLIECRLGSYESSSRVQALSSLTSDQLLKTQQFLIRRYMETHFWNPVTVSAEDPRWESVAFARCDFDLSVAIYDGAECIGASLALKSDLPTIDILGSFADAKNPMSPTGDGLTTECVLTFEKARRLKEPTAWINPEIRLPGASQKIPLEGEARISTTSSQKLVLKELLSTQFELAKSRGFSKASLEVDSTDLALSGLLEWFLIENHSIWKRFRLQISR